MSASTCVMQLAARMPLDARRRGPPGRRRVVVSAKGWSWEKVLGGRGLTSEAQIKEPAGLDKLFAGVPKEGSAPSEAGDRAADSASFPGGDDIYIGFAKDDYGPRAGRKGRVIKGDAKIYPDKEDVGFFIGATGGFAGGEVAVRSFEDLVARDYQTAMRNQLSGSAGIRPPPPLPLLLPGMLARVRCPGNIYNDFTGIVQRVTDGRAAVLFEGGVWDKLVTFPLSSLEKTKEPPPQENPKSAILKDLLRLTPSAVAPPPAASSPPPV